MREGTHATTWNKAIYGIAHIKAMTGSLLQTEHFAKMNLNLADDGTALRRLDDDINQHVRRPQLIRPKIVLCGDHEKRGLCQF